MSHRSDEEESMFTRRGLLAGSAAALLSGTIDSRAQETAKISRVKVIDVHAHWYPPEWVALLEREGDANGAKIGRNQRGNVTIQIPGLTVSFQPQYIDIGSRLAAMDKAGVAMHALSLTQPMAFWAPPAFGLKLCQTYNDACAALHQMHPDRFVGLAMLPMQDQALAVAEFDRIAGLPGIRGIYMATHINGRNLDDKEFWPVYARCEERGLPILLHPVNPVGADRMRSYHLRNFIGNPTDTAIAAASLIFSGALDAFPKLDVVLPHAGGVVPILIGRWDHGATVRPEVKDLKNPPSRYLRRFHYDTVAHSGPVLMNLARQVGVDRIVTGTDFPADMSVVDPVATVEGLTELSAGERDLILRGNAARLLKLEG
jgi:aminocarboxymuconate-semialdehyde decarboxylase